MRTRTGTSGLVFALAVAAGLILPAASPGAITIGAKLETLTPLAGAYNCDVTQCTLINAALAPANTASGGLTSPVTGTITGFRLRTGVQPASAVELRVARGSGATFTGAGTGPPVNQAANQTILHPVSLPIRAGDYVGLNCCTGDDGVTTADVPGSGTYLVWGTVANLPLADGETRAFDSEHQDDVVMMNADVEPTNTFTLAAPTRRGRSVGIIATVPNPGRVSLVPPPCCKKKKKKLSPRLTGAPVTANGPGAVTLKLKFSKKSIAPFRKFKRSFQVSYAPTYGQASQQSFKVTYKAKGKKKA